MAISLILGAQGVMAAPTIGDVNIEQVSGGPGANRDNITFQPDVATETVYINQAGSGNGATAAEQNRINLIVGTTVGGVPAGNATISLGQGYFGAGNPAIFSVATKGNLIDGTINAGTVNVSQNSDNNTATLNVNNSGGNPTPGTVNLNQGRAVVGGGGGGGFTATITQTGSGVVTVNQGNDASSVATSGTATANNSNTGDIVITQDSTIAGDAGTISATNSGAGIINSNTDTQGVSAGSLTITNTNSGNVYVNSTGVSTGTAAAAILKGTAILSNLGTGDIGLKQVGAGGVVNAYTTLASNGNLLIDNGGTSNTVNVGTSGGNAGALISSTNTSGSGATGTLTLIQSANSSNNVINVEAFSGGLLTISQNSSVSNSSIDLLGGLSSGTNAVVNQTGDYQDANLRTDNGSIGNFNLDAAGTTGAHSYVNLTL